MGGGAREAGRAAPAEAPAIITDDGGDGGDALLYEAPADGTGGDTGLQHNYGSSLPLHVDVELVGRSPHEPAWGGDLHDFIFYQSSGSPARNHENIDFLGFIFEKCCFFDFIFPLETGSWCQEAAAGCVDVEVWEFIRPDYAGCGQEEWELRRVPGALRCFRFSGLEASNNSARSVTCPPVPPLRVGRWFCAVLLTQAQMAELFQTTKQNVSLHIRNTFEEKELEELRTVKEYLTVQKEGSRDMQRRIVYYNLDVIISVGYRVRSNRGTQFRMWATQRLREYIVKGFTLDDERLKEGGRRNDYFDELIERVREIRTSEKNFYRKITDIYGTSYDYDSDAARTKQFFATVQNKFHWAIDGHTAAELIAERADASKPPTWA